MKTLTIKVPDSLYSEIASAARMRNLTKSEIVRERLSREGTAASAKKPSLWSRMEDLVIDDRALPIDLSSNRTHLKGYGKKGAR